MPGFLGEVRMGKAKARTAPKKSEMEFHKYVLRDITLKNKDGTTSTSTYIIYSRMPLEVGELSKLKKGESTAVEGEELTKKLLSNDVALRAIRWVDAPTFEAIGVDIKKAITSDGEIIDEVPVGMVEQMHLLHQAFKNAESSGISLIYEGKIKKPKKEFIGQNTVPSKRVNEFTQEKVA